MIGELDRNTAKLVRDFKKQIDIEFNHYTLGGFKTHNKENPEALGIYFNRRMLKDFGQRHGNSAINAVILHEIGHYVDFCTDSVPFKEQLMFISDGEMLEYEKRANQYAIMLASKYNINLDQSFIDALLINLQSYGMDEHEASIFILNEIEYNKGVIYA